MALPRAPISSSPIVWARAAAEPVFSASSVYAFSDHSPIVATFED